MTGLDIQTEMVGPSMGLILNLYPGAHWSIVVPLQSCYKIDRLE